MVWQPGRERERERGTATCTVAGWCPHVCANPRQVQVELLMDMHTGPPLPQVELLACAGQKLSQPDSEQAIRLGSGQHPGAGDPCCRAHNTVMFSAASRRLER